MLSEIFPELTTQDNLSASVLLPLENYELLEEIGRGAHGIVYKARHRQLGHFVAIKVIASGPFASVPVQSRFLREARVAANSRHPSIVRVLEFGKAAGCFWFAMDFIDGENLAVVLQRRAPSFPIVCEWIEKIALAVDHTHHDGVVHRDIKPSNILIDTDGNPHLTDFGLASVEDALDLTFSNQAMGTFHYSSPEQVTNASSAKDPADIYALGAVLYHCLCGQPPFAATTMPALLRAVTDRDPVPPSQFNPKIPKDLENICLKCLEKEPARRYPTARALADDLARFQKGEPVVARPVSKVSRALRWLRRKPALAAMSALLLSAILLGAILSFKQSRHAENLTRSENNARAAANSAQRAAENNAIKEMILSAEQETHSGRLNEALARIAWVLRRDGTSKVAGSWCRALLNFSYVLPITDEIPLETNGVIAFFNPGGETLMTAEENGIIRLWDAGKQPRQYFVTNFAPPIIAAAFSPDSKRIAIAASDGLHVLAGNSQPTELFSIKKSRPRSLGFSPDSTRLAVGFEDGEFVIFNLQSDQPLWSTNAQTGIIRALAWSGSGKHLLTGDSEGWVQIWDAQKRIPTFSHHHASSVGVVAWSADESLFAFGADDGKVRLHTRNNGVLIKEPSSYSAEVAYLAFHPREPKIFSVAKNGAGRVFTYEQKRNASPRRPIRVSKAHPELSISGDGHFFAALFTNGVAVICSGKTGEPVMPAIVQHSGIRRCALNPQRTRLATLSDSATLRIWDIPPDINLQRTLIHTVPIRNASFCGTNQMVATLDDTGDVALWKIPPKLVPGEFFETPFVLPTKATAMHASSDGRFLLTWQTNEARLWSLRDHQPTGLIFHKTADASADSVFSPTGDYIALRKDRHSVSVCESATGKILRDFPAEQPSQVAFSPREDLMAVGDEHGIIKLWRIGSGEIKAETQFENAGFRGFEFSPDGKLLLAGSKLGLVQIYDVASLKPAIPPINHSLPMLSSRFSPDGTLILACLQDGSIRITDWSRPDAPSKSYTQGESAAGPVLSAFLSQNQQWLAGFGSDKRCRITDIKSDLLLRPSIFHKSRSYPASFSPDGRWLLIAESNYQINFWSMNDLEVGRNEPWLADFLDDLTGIRVKDDGTYEQITRLDLHRLQEKYPLAQWDDRAWLPFQLR